MITKKPMQLKAFIKKAAKKNISAQGKLNTPFRCCSMTAASASLLMLWKQNGGINVLSEMRKELSADEAGFRELTDPMLYKLSSVFSGDYVKPARYPRFDE